MVIPRDPGNPEFGTNPGRQKRGRKSNLMKHRRFFWVHWYKNCFNAFSRIKYGCPRWTTYHSLSVLPGSRGRALWCIPDLTTAGSGVSPDGRKHALPHTHPTRFLRPTGVEEKRLAPSLCRNEAKHYVASLACQFSSPDKELLPPLEAARPFPPPTNFESGVHAPRVFMVRCPTVSCCLPHPVDSQLPR